MDFHASTRRKLAVGRSTTGVCVSDTILELLSSRKSVSDSQLDYSLEGNLFTALQAVYVNVQFFCVDEDADCLLALDDHSESGLAFCPDELLAPRGLFLLTLAITLQPSMLACVTKLSWRMLA